MSLDNYTRWCRWMLLEHGPYIQPALKDIWSSYYKNKSKFCNSKLYFGCGHDFVIQRYSKGWDLCDLRDVPGIIVWDALMGFPLDDGSLAEVKSKLSLGMFTTDQVKYIFREVARLLADSREFDLTFRDFDRLLERRSELNENLFVRYIYGSGKYYGSRRRSCWTTDQVISLADKYNLVATEVDFRGMNAVMRLTRVPGKLRKFSPEPKVKFDEQGTMINDGGDFPSESRGCR